MKSGTTSFSKLTSILEYSGGFPPPFQTWEKRTQWSQTLAVSALVRGDRKAPNPWAYSIRRVAYPTGRVVYSFNNRIFRDTEGVLTTDDSHFPAVDLAWWDTLAYNGALDRLVSKIRGGLDLATSLAEAGQTVKMLNLVKRYVDVAVDMRNSYRREVVRGIANKLTDQQARKRLNRWQSGLSRRHPGLYRPIPPAKKRGLAAAVTGNAANGWMEYTYGLSPLVSDIRGVADQVVRHARNSMRIKAKCKQDMEGKLTFQISNWAGFGGTLAAERTGFAHCEISVRLLPDWDKGLDQWTSLNPVSVAYELMHLSFVIDWLFDIGSYIRNLETSMLYSPKFLDGYVSNLIKYEDNLVGSSGIKKIGGDTYALTRATSSLQRITFNRAKLSSFPAPRPPQFKAELGSGRLISAAALLRQLIRR